MKKINVSKFIHENYKEYRGDSSFLVGPSDKTLKIKNDIDELIKIEKGNGGVLDMETVKGSSITAYGKGYISEEDDVVVGLQTDKALKRAFFPNGGIKVAVSAANSYGYEISDEVIKLYTDVRKTHNQGVFDAYDERIRKARRSSIITGLPDGYGRGRIIGDYRRVALYGVDYLIENKLEEKDLIKRPFTEDKIRLREEVSDQIKALKELKELGLEYGFDIGKPAENSKEAIQWLYLGYLSAVKEQNGAAMSFGRTATFLDIYIERDLEKGLITEEEAQELIDQLVLKLRIVRFARTPEYNELFTGDPTWVTESLGGMLDDKRSLVSKTTFRFLQTLYNLGTAPEPNLTVLWSENLPQKFKEYCTKVSIDTSSIQYENDDLIRVHHGNDYAIACCVSPMKVGKEMQFFGARANLAKALLYSINGGKDELTGVQVFEKTKKEVLVLEKLDYDLVMENFKDTIEELAEIYVDALNIIHYMHDKYSYESIEMALHDTNVKRFFATGIAGLSVVADSLSAIKYANVKPIYNEENNLVVDFEIDGEFPKFGNNDDRVDNIAKEVMEIFMEKLKLQDSYRDSEITTSILTITSNVVYGKNTGNTPDGRKKGVPFAPGANPMHQRDNTGSLNSLLSVSKLPYELSRDGISNTFTIIPDSLGKTADEKIENLTSMLNGYFLNGGYHLNVNVFDLEMLKDAYDNPENYPNLTIRVSGYAVNFSDLTNEQKLEVMSRTFHK